MSDEEHFMECAICRKPFDMRDFAQVVIHEHKKHMAIVRVGKRIKKSES